MKLELKPVSQTHKWNSSDLFIAIPPPPSHCFAILWKYFVTR